MPESMVDYRRSVATRVFSYAPIYTPDFSAVRLLSVGENATLNANYMAKLFHEAGFELAFPERRATHEFIISLKKEAKEMGVTTMDFAKRLWT